MGRRVLGVLAGRDMELPHFAAWVSSADVCWAADGGADRLLEVGRVADIAIGDLDSISADGRLAQRDLRLDTDQNTSDCDKLLGLAAAMEVTEITLIGIEGDRLDHVLGSLHSAARSPLLVRLALRRDIAWVLKGPASMTLSAGGRISLLPLTTCSGVSFHGVKWPLSEANLDPLGLTSLSNLADADQISVEVQSGTAVLFVEGSDPAWPES